MRELIYQQPKPRYPSRKPGWRAKHTAKKRRAEGPVSKRVRARCVERDGDCRICEWEMNPHDTHPDEGSIEEGAIPYPTSRIENPSEWAHLEDGKRHKTRGMAPERRHTTEKSAMLCRFHHRLYDAGKLIVRFLTSLGADGPLDWSTP